MPTNLDLDDKKIDELVALGKFKSKKDAVNSAIDEAIKRRRQASLIELFGTIDYDEDYDYKKLRSRRKHTP